jgi:HD-like signal output (HDOD) protein
MAVLRVDACKARRKQAAQVPRLPDIALDIQEEQVTMCYSLIF